MNRDFSSFFHGEEKACMKMKNFVSTQWEIMGSKMRKLFKGFALAAIVVLVAVLFALPSGQKTTTKPKMKLNPEQSEKLRKDITELTAAYQSDCDKLLAGFMTQVETAITPDFVKAHNAVPQVVKQVSGFGNCVSLSYKATKDKLTGSHDFDTTLQDALKPTVLEPCAHAYQVANDQLSTLYLRLQVREMQYVQEIAALGREYHDVGLDHAAVFQELEKSLNNFQKLTVETQRNTIFAGIGVAIDSLFIRSTVSAAHKLFMGIIGKLAGSASTGAICAVADGPIPVGDIIGAVIVVGGTICTAKDIYDVSCIMPKKLSAELNHGLNQTKTNLLSEMRCNTAKLVKQFQENGRKLSQDALAQL